MVVQGRGRTSRMPGLGTERREEEEDPLCREKEFKGPTPEMVKDREPGESGPQRAAQLGAGEPRWNIELSK